MTRWISNCFFLRFFFVLTLFSICHNKLKRASPIVRRLPSSTTKTNRIFTITITKRNLIYNQNDLNEIQRILQLHPNDFYGILNVELVQSQSDLMKAYRKYSLRVHPDRNAAPGANEAMKRVNAARDFFLKKLDEFDQTKRRKNDDAESSHRTSRKEMTEENRSDSSSSVEKSFRFDVKTFGISSSFTKTTTETPKTNGNRIIASVVLLFVFVGSSIGFVIFWRKQNLQTMSNEIEDENEEISE